jgi:hypothetical protein
MVSTDVGAYLESIDWGGGLLAGMAVVVAGLFINWFLQATIDETLTIVPWLRARIAYAIRFRRGAPTLTWFCRTCRSLNDPAADFCYRGCGSRLEHDITIPVEETRGPEAGQASHGG